MTVDNSKPKRDNAVIRIKFVKNANLFKINVNFFRFCSEETGEIVRFLERLQQGFLWSLNF